MTGRRGRGHKQLLNDHTEEIRYWKLKAESLDHSSWRSRFGRGYVTCSKTDYAIHEWCRVSFPLKMEAAGFFFRSIVTCLTYCTSQKTMSVILRVVRASGVLMLIQFTSGPVHGCQYVCPVRRICWCCQHALALISVGRVIQ